MNVNDIISRNYADLWKQVEDKERMIEAKSDDDLFQDAMVRTLKKYSGKDCDEQEVISYFRKTFLTEAKLKNKKVVSEKKYIADIKGFDAIYE